MTRAMVILLFIVLITSCEQDNSPKPRAYPRIDLPEPTYNSTDSMKWHCPYGFEFSKQSVVTIDPRYEQNLCWYNVYYPKLRATVHLTYSPVDNDLVNYIEESRKLAMKHISMASQIEERLIERPVDRVFGIVYDFKGETATDLQFFVTDSTNHFLRGALYFNVAPNKDSLAPVIEYVEKDVLHLIESLKWKPYETE